MNDIDQLKGEIQKILERNHRVELEKAWETSATRAVGVLVVTYVVAALVMVVLKLERPFISAIIPTLGFFLSIQSLPILKRWWIKKQKPNDTNTKSSI